MKRLYLIAIAFLALCPWAWGQTSVGGAQSVPPQAYVIGAYQLTDAGFESGVFGTGKWVGSACPSNTLMDNTVSHTGTYSVKMIYGCTSVQQLWQNVTLSSVHEAVRISYWLKTSSDFVGSVNVAVKTTNNTGLADTPYEPTTVAANSDWVHIVQTSYVSTRIYAGNVAKVDVHFTGTAGTVWIDDVEVEPLYAPMRTFLIYPNYHGYLWSDKTQIIKGVSEIDPPPGLTAASLSMKVDTAAGCPNSNPTGLNQTISSPSILPAVQHWTINGASLTANTGYFICSSVTWTGASAWVGSTVYSLSSIVTDSNGNLEQQVSQTTPSGSSGVSTPSWVASPQLSQTPDNALTWELISTSGSITNYGDWKIVTLSAATRDTSFENWFDVDGTWIHNGVRTLDISTEDRLSGTYRCYLCLWSTGAGCAHAGLPNLATAKDCYIQAINSVAPYSPVPQYVDYRVTGPVHGETVVDWQQNGLTAEMDILPGAAMAPNPPYGGSTDTLTGWVRAGYAYGVAHKQIINNFWGRLIDGTKQTTTVLPTAPSVSVSSTGGTIASGLYVFAKVAGASMTSTGGISMTNTLPSTAGSAGPTTTANSSVTVTIPSCPSGRWLGYYVYVGTNSVNTPPATFQKQGGPIWQVCGSRMILTSIINSNVSPPTVETGNNLPASVPTATPDTTVWTQIGQAMSKAAGVSALGTDYGGWGVYGVDESNVGFVGPVFEQYSNVLAAAPDLSSYSIADPVQTSLWRDFVDLPGYDPYGYGISPGSKVLWAGIPSRPCMAYTATNNTGLQMTSGISGGNCAVEFVDVATDEMASHLYGRQQFVELQLYVRGSLHGYTYDEMKRQYYKALIGCQNWGSLGCAIGSFGWASSSGQEGMWYQYGNTESYYNNQRALLEISGLTTQWLTAVADSPQLNGGTGQVDGGSGETVTGGTVVSNVKVGTALATVCGTLGGATGYIHPAYFPFGPVRWVSKVMPGGNNWIFATNLCSAGAPFNVTFTLANAVGTTVQVYSENRTLPITAGAFTDSWQDLDVHAYLITPNTPAVASLSPSSLAFPPGQVGVAEPNQVITLLNPSSTTLNITSIVATGTGYSVSTTCGSTLAGGSTCTATVAFTPTMKASAAVPITGTLTFTTDSNPNPVQTVALTGNAVAEVAQ